MPYPWDTGRGITVFTTTNKWRLRNYIKGLWKDLTLPWTLLQGTHGVLNI
jgi:hypothetical protein